MNFNKFGANFNIVGNNLKKIRQIKNISQEKLSNKLALLGITLYQSDIYKIEHNERTVRDFELWGIAKVLDVSYDEFFIGIEEKIKI